MLAARVDRVETDLRSTRAKFTRHIGEDDDHGEKDINTSLSGFGL
jgi:hypothetical protein